MTLSEAIHNMVKPMLFGQIGGGAKGHPGNGLLLFIIILVLFLIRAYIVQFAFNQIVPRLIVRLSPEPEKVMKNYRPLNFSEAIFLTLLVGSLVG